MRTHNLKRKYEDILWKYSPGFCQIQKHISFKVLRWNKLGLQPSVKVKFFNGELCSVFILQSILSFSLERNV